MSTHNTIHGRNNPSDRLFETIGLENNNPLTEEEKELCDISFDRYRYATVMENFSLVKIMTRTGGGNRLDYKETIRDIRDHSLYIDDCDCPSDETYAWFYLCIPESKKSAVRALYPHDHVPLFLDKEIGAEDKVCNKLNNPEYVDSESDTDYSDEYDFSSRYGYWKDDVGISESDDGNSTDAMVDDNDTESLMELSVSIEEKMKNMEL